MRAAPIAGLGDTPDEALSAGWFRALDQRTVDVGAKTWVLEVLAIHADGGELWIQVANGGLPQEEIVLHIWRWTPLRQALAAIERWRGRADVYPHVVRVLPTDH